jgi:nitrogen-specific signal transduction histidine kinase
LFEPFELSHDQPNIYFVINEDFKIVNSSISPLIGTSWFHLDPHRILLEGSSSPQHLDLFISQESTPYQVFQTNVSNLLHVYCIPALKKDLSLPDHAAMAHEIRNPLAAIKGFIQLLMPELDELGKQGYGQIIIGEIERANGILEDYLREPYSEKKGMERIQVQSLLRDMQQLYMGQAIQKDIQMYVHSAIQEVEVYGNRYELIQVLTNLIKNAIEASTDDQRKRKIIQLEASADDQTVFIKVSDNGPGMDEQTLHHLFTPYFTTKEEGTGIGLSICRKLLQKYNGQLAVSSELGKGTEFTISYPLYNKES